MTKHKPRIDPDALVAIDMHVHVEPYSLGEIATASRLITVMPAGGRHAAGSVKDRSCRTGRGSCLGSGCRG